MEVHLISDAPTKIWDRAFKEEQDKEETHTDYLDAADDYSDMVTNQYESSADVSHCTPSN
jgi:hypothetical protein